MLEIELRDRECRARLGGAGATGIGLLSRDGRGGEQALGALRLAVGDFGAGAREIELGLIPTRIDGEKHVAFCTSCPAWRRTSSRWPETRARSSTVSAASTRPISSSYSVTSFSSTGATVTLGAGGVGAAGAASAATARDVVV